MIIQGNARGGAGNLAAHLMKDENDHVEIHELRGFSSPRLRGALNEIHAISKATKAKKFLFSCSFNPPGNEPVSTADFEEAFDRVEKKLGLTGQPRAVVFHEKQGRRHAHVVWSRIDATAMKAIKLPFYKYRIMDISRALYFEHGWNMPLGMLNKAARSPYNYTLAQWQQAKRTGQNPKAIKALFKDCWSVSDNQASFQAALKDHGYSLARGDRRGFVILDHKCNIYAVSRWLDMKAKDLKPKLKDRKSLPSVDEVKEAVSQDMESHLLALQNQQNSLIKTRLEHINQSKARLKKSHQAARKQLHTAQEQRQLHETRIRQERYHKGLKGLLDRLTGRHRRIKEQNEWEYQQSQERDQKEKDALIFKQLQERQQLQQRAQRLEKFKERTRQTLNDDMSQYQQVRSQEKENVRFDKQQNQSLRRPAQAPTHER